MIVNTPNRMQGRNGGSSCPVLQFEPDSSPSHRDGSDGPHAEDEPFGVPLTNSVRVGLESLDVVNLESVFEIQGLIMKSVEVHTGSIQRKNQSAGYSQGTCKERY